MAVDHGSPLEFRSVEEELCRIPDVTAARIVADAAGRPIEVHILASPAKQAKQIVRDVQSVAMASFGLDLDRRIISVVQLESVGSVVGGAPGLGGGRGLGGAPDLGAPDLGAADVEGRAGMGATAGTGPAAWDDDLPDSR